MSYLLRCWNMRSAKKLILSSFFVEESVGEKNGMTFNSRSRVKVRGNLLFLKWLLSW